MLAVVAWDDRHVPQAQLLVEMGSCKLFPLDLALNHDTPDITSQITGTTDVAISIWLQVITLNHLV
jgi:hypothetical protein